MDKASGSRWKVPIARIRCLPTGSFAKGKGSTRGVGEKRLCEPRRTAAGSLPLKAERPHLPGGQRDQPGLEPEFHTRVPFSHHSTPTGSLQR